MVKNLKELTKRLNTEQKCIDFLVKQRWNGKPVCPYCGHQKTYTIENSKRFKCANNQCYKKFNVTVGLVFEASNIKLTTWFQAVYIILSHKKGISSIQLGKDLGVTQKTAWFMLHRIRESLKDNNPGLLGGIVESDETYLGRKYRSDYKGLPPEQVEKQLAGKHSRRGAVLGLYERDTDRIVTQVFHDRKAEAIRPVIKSKVKAGSSLYTDESLLYKKGFEDYTQKTVNHYLHEWVFEDAHVNNVEAFWSVLKRGVYGIYHQISFKHLQAYCNEFQFRYNSRKIKDGERFVSHLKNLDGRLTYKMLVNKNTMKI